MKCLLVDDDNNVVSALRLSLEKEFGAECIEVDCVEDAVAQIKSHPDIDSVIADFVLPDGNAADLIQHLQDVSNSATFVLCSHLVLEEIPELKEWQIGYLPKPLQPKLGEALKELLQKSSLEKAPDYVKVNIRTLAQIESLPADLYLKISAEKYLKLRHKKDRLSKPEISKYLAKNVDYLHVRSEEAESFLKYLLSEMLALDDIGQYTNSPDALLKLASGIPDLCLKDDLNSFVQDLRSKSDSPSVVQKSIQLSGKLTQQALGTLNSMGVDAGTQATIKTSVAVAVTSINSSPGIIDQLQFLKIEKDTPYLSAHSTLLAYVSCGLADLAGWGSDTVYNKLCLAAILHDATLNNDMLAKCRSIDQVYQLGDHITNTEVESFIQHPEKAAGMVQLLPESPPDVDQIIIQHHERPDGSGFPSEVNFRRLGPLSTAFIFAHDIVDHMWTHHQNLDLADFLAVAGDEYQLGQFKKIFDALALSLSAAEAS